LRKAATGVSGVGRRRGREASPTSWLPASAYGTIRDIASGGELVTPLLDGFTLDVAALFVP